MDTLPISRVLRSGSRHNKYNFYVPIYPNSKWKKIHDSVSTTFQKRIFFFLRFIVLLRREEEVRFAVTSSAIVLETLKQQC